MNILKLIIKLNELIDQDHLTKKQLRQALIDLVEEFS
jgi:hypothetical protein